MAFIKFILYAFIVGLSGASLITWYNTYVLGQRFVNGDMLIVVMGGILPLAILFIAFHAMRLVHRTTTDDIRRNLAMFIIVLAGGTLAGCNYANANVQTLITDDCGVSWTLINPGQTVPARMRACQYKVTVPDYPLQGETKFKASFKNRVLAEIEIPYDYSITDAKAFIAEAKYLGKPNSDSDDKSNDASVYESAENSVIDKRMRDITAGLLINEDIVDFSQAEFEDRLLASVNEQLKQRGVQINFLAFVPTPEEQTRLAIDMMTAMKVYESKGLGELGQKVAVARASATKIEVGRETASPTQK